jgi:ketosteroid isomerase-like protein
MKSYLPFLLCIILFPCQAQDSPEQALIKLEDERLQAIIKKDTAAILKIYNEHYQGVLASGQSVDKTKLIEFHLSGSPHITLSMEDVKASVYGSIGITTGKQLNKAKSGHVIGQSKFIRVWQKNGNQWTVIRSQGTIVVQD